MSSGVRFYCAPIKRGSGAKVIDFPFKTRIDQDRLGATYDQQKDCLIRQVNVLEAEFYREPFNLGTLRQTVGKHLTQLFRPEYYEINPSPNFTSSRFPQLGQVIEMAAKDNRLLFVPDTGRDEVVFTGQVTGELHEIYRWRLESLGISRSDLGGVADISLAIAPCFSTREMFDTDLAGYGRHGVILMFSSRPKFLYDLAGVVPLRMYSANLALALKKLGL